jgi:hypothetical protein
MVSVTKAERLVAVQLADLRWDARQWARRADSGRSRDCNGAAGVDPKLPFADRETSVTRDCRRTLFRLDPPLAGVSSRGDRAARI